eukprot:5551922-Prymnesium_polylepis.1
MKTILLPAGMPESKLAELRDEVRIHRSLVHPNICRIFDVFEEDGGLHLIMQLCTGGTMCSRLSRSRTGYSERAAATLMEKLLSAIFYCHRHGVVHCDVSARDAPHEITSAARVGARSGGCVHCVVRLRIKLDNFVYESEADEAEPILIDFGIAASVSPGHEEMRRIRGSPSYMAPELLARHPYDSSVDMWALGVVAFLLLSGKRPFDHRNPKEKARMVRQDPLVFPDAQWARVSADAKDFCTQLMQKSPADRMSASEALRHPWIVNASAVHATDSAQLNHSIISSLEAFSHSDDLEKLVFESVAFTTPPARLAELRSIFVAMDTDDSGTISLDELKQAFAAFPEYCVERVAEMFLHMDLHHHGEVDFLEFASAASSAGWQNAEAGRMAVETTAVAAFSFLDRDGDGYLTKDDILSSVDGGYPEEVVEEMLASHGVDGRINFKSFKVLLFTGSGQQLFHAASASRAVSRAASSLT